MPTKKLDWSKEKLKSRSKRSWSLDRYFVEAPSIRQKGKKSKRPYELQYIQQAYGNSGPNTNPNKCTLPKIRQVISHLRESTPKHQRSNLTRVDLMNALDSAGLLYHDSETSTANLSPTLEDYPE